MKLCVVVPTIGRDSLLRTLDSLTPQLTADDVGIIACDATGADADAVTRMTHGSRFVVFQVGSKTAAGHHATNFVLDHLPSDVTHTWRIDDDDVASPGALAALRGAACSSPVFARFRYVDDGLVWDSPVLQEANIGSPCILAPRSAARWGDRYEGDFDYAKALVKELGDPLWLNAVVAEVTLIR